MGESFDFRSLRVTLVCLKIEVSPCLEWVDLGLSLAGLGSRSDPEKLALVKPKPNPIVNSLSKHPSKASSPDLPLVADSNSVSKGKVVMGSFASRVKLSLKPRAKLSLK